MIRSLLPVIDRVDNFPYYPLPPAAPPTPYIPFHLTLEDCKSHLVPLGLLRPDVVQEMRLASEQWEERTGRGIWKFELVFAYDQDTESANQGQGKSKDDLGILCAYFTEELVKEGRERITEVLAEVTAKWKKEGKFPGPLAGWRNELYTVYASPQSTGLQRTMIGGTSNNQAFNLERAACALFGVATYGVHMTAYEGEGSDMKVWVPRRSKTKATWPSKLDNSVAGGITAGMTAAETIVKECDEEANLPEEFVRQRVKQTGVTTYFYITDDGFLQPEVEWIYDLPLPPAGSAEYVRPAPHDDEVESFALRTIPELIEALHSGDMKPNCGLIYVDFLIRHGLITPDNEPYFFEINSRLKRRLGVALPGA